MQTIISLYQTMNNGLIGLGFIIIWTISFPIAWKIVAELIAQSIGQKNAFRSARFWYLFVIYRLVIVAPYAWVLFFGRLVPDLLQKAIIGWILLGLFLSVFRFIGTVQVVRILWWIYGFFYDGLNAFYPYRNLLDLVYKRLKLKGNVSVLDLGCGTGNLTKKMVSGSPMMIVGVDSSSSMLAKAKRKMKGANVLFVHEDLLEYLERCPGKKFDRIALVNVVYAVSDRSKLWGESLRVLKEDGLIVMTTSDRAGSKALITEHVAQDKWWKLLHPRLIVVGIIDSFISEFSKTQVFNFVPEEKIIAEIESAGCVVSDVQRCYGGKDNGVNILMTISRKREVVNKY